MKHILRLHLCTILYSQDFENLELIAITVFVRSLLVPNAANPQMRLYSLLQKKCTFTNTISGANAVKNEFFRIFLQLLQIPLFSIQIILVIIIEFTQHSACAATVELRNRAAALELERNATKFGPSLSRSRSAQSLKLLGDTATQVRNIFVWRVGPPLISCCTVNVIINNDSY